MKFAFLYILISLVCIPCFAQQDSSELQIHSINSDLSYGYRKPKLFDIVTNIPKNYIDLGKGLKQKNNLAWLGFTLATTAAMIPYDQEFVDHAQNISLSANLPRKHKYINPFLGFEIPPWISLVDDDEVCAARSSFSHSKTLRPRPARSRAMPAPLMPPPTTSTSSTGSAVEPFRMTASVFVSYSFCPRTIPNDGSVWFV